MTRLFFAFLLALGLAACSAPLDQLKAPSPAPQAEPVVMESIDPCQSGEDGIGGTGCPEL
ncbi:MAG: hypothetical protein ACRBB0_04310 [Pelagimonas sp.]|uniref:hypothetical protein n=1 Tax=Pelagimonas sp. TaxID=2073170 RepID=UPI003D6A04B4